MNVVVKLEANIQWHTRPSTTSARWIGVCEPMNLSMEAETLDELHSVIEETMQLVLTDLLRENELQEYLEEHGWRASNLDSATVNDDVAFDVPWQMITERPPLDSERRVN